MPLPWLAATTSPDFGPPFAFDGLDGPQLPHQTPFHGEETSNVEKDVRMLLLQDIVEAIAAERVKHDERNVGLRWLSRSRMPALPWREIPSHVPAGTTGGPEQSVSV